ncbi:MAG: hypothetical protein H0T51_04105 [Pirellulales bacterium]|nr:hypothetical protein [Pirellulales bacterium]
MRIRFSLRTLLIGTIAVAAIAAFVALRQKPAHIAAQFQDTIQRGESSVAAAMIYGANILQTLDLSQADSWELESFDFNSQSFSQWLQGKCKGRLVVTSHSSSESHDAIWSVIQTSHCDVAVSARGVRILQFTKEEPAVMGIPKNAPYETDVPDQPTND